MINLKKKQCTRGKLDMLNNICKMLSKTGTEVVPFDLLNLAITVFELMEINSNQGKYALEVLLNVLMMV
jgi:hypothetical protein